MITEDKVTEIFCIIDEFCKFFEQENGKKLLLGSDGKKHRMRKASLSDSEIMTIHRNCSTLCSRMAYTS